MSHRRFDDDDEFMVETRPRPVDNASDGSEDNSDDDAPAEESMSASADRIKQLEQQTRTQALKAKQAERERRRKKNEMLKQQKDQSRAHVTPLTAEAIAEHQQALTGTNSDLESDHEEQDLQALMIEKKRFRGHKTIFNKGPVRVQVVKPTSRALAPPSTRIVSTRRDRFLHRKSVFRR